MGTFIVGVILVVIVAAIVRSMIKDKKNGKGCGDCSHCGGGCGGGSSCCKLLRKRGFRVTKQRELILDIVFEHECASCKEIYYQAIQRDPGIGMATVYRMVNTLTDIGVLKVATLKPQTALGSGSGCQILLKNQNKIVLNQTEWTEVLQNVLRRKGYNYNAADEIVEVTIQ